ncbi:MAG: hypothetical protein ACLPT4_08105 [Verrucomicrobiia bacterium]
MSDRLCQWPDCGRDAGPGWGVQGSFYCGSHYFPALEQAFRKALATWDGAAEPSSQFKNLFSRHVESLYPAGGMPGKLSQAKIEERGASWKKTPAGVEFSIVRHLPAYRLGGFVKTVAQQWRFALQTKELVLVNQQDVKPRKLKRIAVPSKSAIPAPSRVNR